MFFPEFLYQLSQRDSQVTWLDPVIERIQTTAAAATVEAQFTVPEARALILQSALVTGSPGAGQAVNAMTLSLIPPNQVGPVRALKFNDTNNALNFVAAIDWQGSMILPPSWIVNANVGYDAAVAANTTTLHVFGILVPIGNVQRV